MKGIVLASASPRRMELLRQIGLSFTVQPSHIDERMEGDPVPEEYASGLALKKAYSVAEKLHQDGSAQHNCLVIGADTVVVKDRILGKPEDDRDACCMLAKLQGQWHEVITGVALVDVTDLRYQKSYEVTRVRMRSLTDDQIKAYINTGETWDKAGAYGIQGMGALLVEKIEGCYFNVVGLPLMRLSWMLKDFGIQVL